MSDTATVLRAAATLLADYPGAESPVCFHCDRPATLLCDGVLGWVKAWDAEGERWVIDTRDRTDFKVSCDRPLCRECAREVGRAHWCFDGGCDVDTLDLCRDCESVTEAPKVLVKAKWERRLVTEEEGRALQLRQQMRGTGEHGPASLAAHLFALADTLASHPECAVKSESP